MMTTTPMNHSLAGKTAVVLGVADRESLAWSIARTLQQQGAQVKVGYQQKFFSRVRKLLEETQITDPQINGQKCDVLNPDELALFFQPYDSQGLDILVHAIAYGPPAVFTELPSDIHSSDFSETLEISTHSLAKVVHYARPYLKPWASVITLTFQASQRALPMYGMMGVAKAALESLVRYLALELGKDRIRVNAISAGPIETLASLSEVIAFQRSPEAIKKLPDGLLKSLMEKSSLKETDEFQSAKFYWEKIQDEFAKRSPIPEKLVAEDIAQSVLFFSSESSRKITGQVLNVDCGFSSCQLF